ncbi:Outer membrane receptor proteins [Proteiniphilum saccharofermentans]|uniref:Outer membrane receptor proteins n=1 Tax=Proteiniphilum saccharofermentans TaxID=1642647 RepID=A0A1R3T1F1_9BACT|nr:carboxypeptidase regulatory-like domain-containing protein [Proteiniphilum saccharofermentans]SCD19959.1 Outer membrane receptor proteins [Proteiniphilum saccharofermentans]
MVKKLKFLSVALTLMMATVMQAQVTTSSMSGRVTDADGAVIGATVIATHQPSGTTYGTVTNMEGRYNLNGMRVGGPYTVEISYIGYGDNIAENITLSLGENYVHNVVLVEETVTLSEVTVTAQRTRFTAEKTGAATNINNQQLSTMPTINRSVQDITRLSPYAGTGLSFSGGDGRSTNFTVDGANFNNNFGLSSNLPGGGNPISLDAFEELQVVVTPFDVRQTNFIGGGVNAITKSGTNTFRGSAYTYFTNQDLQGSRIGDTFLERAKESTTTYGATFGGPIIKNKLFFFVNAEMEKRPGQVVYWRPSENGIADEKKQLSRASVTDMERVRNHLIENYGYDPGSYNDYPGDESNMKLLARLDWNINNQNKLSFRYNYTKNQAWNPTNGNSTDAGLRNRNMDRISQYGMAFSNSLYTMDNIINGFSLDLNSRFSDNLSNQFLVTYTKIKDMRGSPSDPFPFIDILVGRDENNVPIVEPYISAGYELFTWNNGVNNNKFSVTDNLTYYLNNHKITAGLNYEYQMANNSYMRNGTGYYRYASVEDFLNQAAPIDFALDYGYDGEKNPTAQVAFHQIGAYAQDEWNLSPSFKLTYGLRADYISYVDNLIRNNAIYDLDFNGKKIDTGKWPTPKVQFSPRVGFTWDVKEDKSFVVRGGTGIFTGRLPLVFFTNMPTQGGMVKGIFTAKTTYANGVSSSDPILASLSGKMITNIDEMISKLNMQNTISPEDGALQTSIAGVDPDFKMPQVWKSSLAVDYQLPTSFPFTVTLEGIYTKKLNDVMLVNYNMKDPDDSWQRFKGADDRYIYPAVANRYYNYHNNNPIEALVLSNNSEGWGAIGNITLTAQPVKDLNLMAAYTYTESKEISGMPGSSAGSAYGGLIAIDGPHLPTLQRSQYVTPHRVVSSISYRIPWENNILLSNTTLNLFYTGYSYSGYSYTYKGDMNGDGYAADLIYIPSGKGDIKFASAEDETAFFAFMEQDKYLKANKGKYAGANAVLAPWLHRFDFRIAREFYVNVGQSRNSLELSLDFLNVGNLLKSTWGVMKNMSSSNGGQILERVSTENDNTPVFSMVKIKDADGNDVYPTQTFTTNYSLDQTWQLQVGVRYKFN